VSRFYPELYRRGHSKYLSATCFYLMVHHFFRISRMDSSATIYLTAKPSVFSGFYERLRDFDFRIHGSESCRYVRVISAFEGSKVDTSMIVNARASAVVRDPCAGNGCAIACTDLGSMPEP
jgi:hypothetical protein